MGRVEPRQNGWAAYWLPAHVFTFPLFLPGILTCPVLPHVCPSRLVCLFWETSPEVECGVLSVALCHLPGAWDIVDPLRAVLIAPGVGVGGGQGGKIPKREVCNVASPQA